ncbi:MAG: 50S ribosomal protein L28 [Chloroflexi bacterium]|nr:50S ribosomal protein L28 [Chloroflexota bacterium]
MARCEICSKVGQSGNKVSHSHRKTRTRWSANVHKATLYEKGVRRRVNICTRCLRSHYKVLVKG